MFRRKEKKIKLTRAEKKEYERQDFIENMPRHLTIKLIAIIWFVGTGYLLKFYGNKVTLAIMGLTFLVSFALGYIIAGFIFGKYKDKVLWFYGIKDEKQDG